MNIQNSPESRSQRKTDTPNLRFPFEAALKRHPTLSAKARRYGAVLSLYMDNKTGVARPGRRTLKEIFAFTSVATKYDRELMDAHLMRIESKGNGTPNRYRSLCTWGENASVILGDGTELKSPRYESEESENRTRIGHGSDDDDRAQMRHAPNPNQAHPVPESGTNHSSSSPLMRKHEGGGGGTRPKAGASPKGSAPAPDTNSTPASAEDLRIVRAWLEEHLARLLPKSARVEMGYSPFVRIAATRLRAGWKPDRLALRVTDGSPRGVKSWARVLRKRLELLPETPDEVERVEEERIAARSRMMEELGRLRGEFELVRLYLDGEVGAVGDLSNEELAKVLQDARATAFGHATDPLWDILEALGGERYFDFAANHDLLVPGATRDDPIPSDEEALEHFGGDIRRALDLVSTAEKCSREVRFGKPCVHRPAKTLPTGELL